MRRIILFLFLMGATVQAMAQRIKYHDLFPLLAGMSKEEQKNSLKEYLSLDPDHPNANFRLAMVYEFNYKNADPLTQYEFALANAEQAKARFLKAKLIVDEHEVTRNNEYYNPVFKTVDARGKPNVEFALVSRKIVNGYDSTGLFLEKIPPIYSSFTRSVNFYDRAVKIFAALNDEFVNLDDFYLYFNSDVDKQLGELKQNFDSARFFFDRYQDLTQAFPIAFHKQKYHVRPIVTYRLDGLITRMNFLTNDVELWDYTTWVNGIRKNINTEISLLRLKLNQNEEKLDESLLKIAASNGEGIIPFKLDKQLVFNLNNYDKQSLVLSVLDYKSFKQDWLIKSKVLHEDTARIDRNAENYSILIYANKMADTLLDVVKTRLQKDKVRKHADFVNKYYGGMEGLLKFSSDEKHFIETSFLQYTAELRTVLVVMSAPDTAKGKEKLIRFNNRWNVSLLTHLLTPELLEKGEPVTLQNLRNPDGSTYLAGVYKPDKKINNVVTFVARVNPDGKPGWFQNFNIKMDSASATADTNNFLGPLQLTQEGCAFLIHSIHLTRSDQRNTFVYLNEKGEDKFRLRLKEKDFPRKLTFIERSNSFVILLKGQAEKQNYTTPENIQILSINALGDLLWKREINLTGSLVNLVNLIDGYLIVGNYTVLKDLNGKEYRAKIGESSPYLIKLNERGDFVRVSPIATAKSIYVVDVVKVSDNSINLLGFEDTFESAQGKTVLSSGRIIHIMANRFCQVICSNL